MIKKFIISFIFVLLICETVTADYWNISWASRKEIILTGNTSGALTNYQILLNVSWVSGMQTDFADLRFCNNTHEIDSWLESKVDSSYALVWVEFPTTPANGVIEKYWMYYGKADAVSNWDGGAVFLQWHGASTSNFLDSTTISSSNFIYEGRVRTSASGHNLYWGVSNQVSATDDLIGIQSNTITNLRYMSTGNEGTVSKIQEVPSFNINTWYKLKTVFNGTIVKGYVDKNEIGTGGITTNLPNENLGLWMHAFSGIIEQSWSFARKYALGPPTHTFGDTAYYAGTIHYNTSTPYNHTIEADGTITTNHTIVAIDNINWTAATVLDDCYFIVFEYNLSNITVTNFTIYNASLNWVKVTNLTIEKIYNLTNGTTYEQRTANVNGDANFTTDLIQGDYQILFVQEDYTPPDPTNFVHATGNFWVNHTWTVGSGNVTDSYNVSVNDVWYNTTINTYYNDTYSPHAWQNITVWAYNSSTDGTLSVNNITQKTQIPNNPVFITNTSDWSGDAGNVVYVDYDGIDADSDTLTFSCNRTDLFTDFDTSIGKGNWTSTVNIYYVDFGVSDEYGSISNYTMTLTELSIEPSGLLDEIKLIMSEVTKELKNVEMGNYLVYAFILIGILLIIFIIRVLNNNVCGG